MKSVKNYIFSVICASVALCSGCRDQQWENHNKSDLTGNLLEALQKNPQCSRFYEAIVKAGYSELLASDNNFTVLAPDNNAMQGVDMNNEDALRKFLSNHIAYGQFLNSNPELRQGLRMINTKVIKYDEQNHFCGAQITLTDQTAGNGVFHVINKVIDTKKNIWEYISPMENLKQVEFIHKVNRREMDMERSISVGIDLMGRPIYDTAWINVNRLLRIAPIDSEYGEYTYLVLNNDGFDWLFGKYRNFFTLSKGESTDSLTKFNVCQDFIFNGVVDITQFDTLTNIFGVKVPVKEAVIAEQFDASNGRVYLIDQSNILYKEKFKPVLIEGEKFNRSFNNHYVFTRNSQWASNKEDIVLSARYTQSDSIVLKNISDGDSTAYFSQTFQSISGTKSGNGEVYANVVNFWIEYKAQVHSVDYKIHYMAYDDLDTHQLPRIFLRAGTGGSNPREADTIAQITHLYRPEQKLYISMPGRPVLQRGGKVGEAEIVNNYLDVISGQSRSSICFVAQDTASIQKERIMRQWTLKDMATSSYQYLDKPVGSPDNEIMKVDRAGALTLWLCNTARSANSNVQGPLFLDYIRLEPQLPQEPIRTSKNIK